MTIQKTTTSISMTNLLATSAAAGDFRRPSLPKRSLSTIGGACHFAYRSDLDKYLTRPSNEPYAPCLHFVRALLEDEQTREYDVQDDLNVYLPQRLLTRNIGVFGQIGSGKTQRVMNVLTAQAIADPEQSVIILGTKGDEYDVFREIASELRPGGRVECLNLSNRYRSTVRWNPLDVVDEENAEGELRAIAEAWHESALESSHSHDSPYFKFTAIRLIAGLAIALRDKFGRVSPRDICDVLESYSTTISVLEYGAARKLPFVGGIKETLQGDTNKNSETTWMEAQAACQHLRDRDLSATTSTTTIDLGELFEKPTILVLEVPQYASGRIKPFLNMFFSQLFNRIPRKAYSSPNRRLPRPLAVFVDDFGASVGRIAECAQRLNMMRSMDVRFTLALQSASQLEQYYTHAESEAILAACGTKIFLPPTSLEDARLASSASGECSVFSYDEGAPESSSTERRGRVGFLRESDVRGAAPNGVASRYGMVQSRSLLLSSDVQYSPADSVFGYAATVFLPETPPFQGWLPAAYQLPFFEKALEASSQAAERPHAEVDAEDAKARSYFDMGSFGTYKVFGSNPPVYVTPSGSVDDQIAQLRGVVDYDNTKGSARKWWDAFESENQERKPLILRFLQELGQRGASLNEFFLAYVYSNTDNIQANLYYLDYTRLKKEEAAKEARERQEAGDDDVPDLGSSTDDSHLEESEDKDEEDAPVYSLSTANPLLDEPDSDDSDDLDLIEFLESDSESGNNLSVDNGKTSTVFPSAAVADDDSSAVVFPGEDLAPVAGESAKLREDIEYSETRGDAKIWWNRVEKSFGGNADGLENMMREMSSRHVTISNLFYATLRSREKDVMKILRGLGTTA